MTWKYCHRHSRASTAFLALLIFQAAWFLPSRALSDAATNPAGAAGAADAGTAAAEAKIAEKAEQLRQLEEEKEKEKKKEKPDQEKIAKIEKEQQRLQGEIKQLQDQIAANKASSAKNEATAAKASDGAGSKGEGKGDSKAPPPQAPQSQQPQKSDDKKDSQDPVAEAAKKYEEENKKQMAEIQAKAEANRKALEEATKEGNKTAAVPTPSPNIQLAENPATTSASEDPRATALQQDLQASRELLLKTLDEGFPAESKKASNLASAAPTQTSKSEEASPLADALLGGGSSKSSGAKTTAKTAARTPRGQVVGFKARAMAPRNPATPDRGIASVPSQEERSLLGLVRSGYQSSVK